MSEILSSENNLFNIKKSAIARDGGFFMYSGRSQTRKSIFQNSTKTKRVKKAIEHNLRHSPFRRKSCFVMFQQAKRKLAKEIQILLYRPVFHTAVILAIMNIQQPVHCFYCPLHTSMTKKLLCLEFTAGDIIMPLFGFFPSFSNSVLIAPIHRRSFHFSLPYSHEILSVV